MPNIIFHPDITHEIKASYHWYQLQSTGLGDDLLAELESADEVIAVMHNSKKPGYWLSRK